MLDETLPVSGSPPASREKACIKVCTLCFIDVSRSVRVAIKFGNSTGEAADLIDSHLASVFAGENSKSIALRGGKVIEIVGAWQSAAAIIAVHWRRFRMFF